MMRRLYRWLLAMHPAVYRRRFAAEMLWIFEEQESSGASLRLVGDGVLSLLRQWLVRSEAWKVLTAVAIGIAQALAVGTIWHFSAHVRRSSSAAPGDWIGCVLVLTMLTGGLMIIVCRFMRPADAGPSISGRPVA